MAVARIEDYALIGDCRSAALVGRDGSIDWLCWPRFDASACFAALLGTRDHGRWLLQAASKQPGAARRYRENTLILETEFDGPGGSASVVDFMPTGRAQSTVVRVVVGGRGEIAMRTELAPRFGYGLEAPEIRTLDDGALLFTGTTQAVVLRTPVALRRANGRVSGEFKVAAGQRVAFTLTYASSAAPIPAVVDPLQSLRETEQTWRNWAARYHGRGQWADAAIRSLLTLKALTYEPSGSIVAAPTTSLPEQMGGSRNWDYRFCWLRDATFGLLALMNAGYFEEAAAWRNWLLRAIGEQPSRVQIMYSVSGDPFLPERELPWLPGYEGSKPVRVGNAAVSQMQNDIYGEITDAIYQGRKRRLAPDEAGWELQIGLLEHLKAVWSRPGHGIWEMRGEARHFTHTKVMAWVAFDRAVRSAEEFGLVGPVERWKVLRAEIHDEICRRAYNADIGAFTQFYGSSTPDASLLLMPLVGFLPPTDPRVQGTIKAIEKHLMVDGLIMRYPPYPSRDGVPGGEGAFIACSFWFADNLLMVGRRKAAEAMFQRLLALSNDVGLLSEEYDPVHKRLVGNFPQALSHVALLTTVDNLSQHERPAEQRSGRPALRSDR